MGAQCRVEREVYSSKLSGVTTINVVIAKTVVEEKRASSAKLRTRVVGRFRLLGLFLNTADTISIDRRWRYRKNNIRVSLYQGIYRSATQ